MEHFHKTIYSPDYTQLPPLTVVEEHGDLEVFAGSRVRLELELNMPVSEACLRWTTAVSSDVEQPSAASTESEQSAASTELSIDAQTGRVFVEFAVERSGAYRVHLASSDTGFTNDFSPVFRITAIADGPPRLAWVKPVTASVVAAREEIRALQLHVDDELPVARVVQRLRVNSGAWSDSELAAPLEKSGDIDWNLDLLPLELTAGDYVDLQLVVTDRQGQVSQSTPLQIMVSATSIHLVESEADRQRQLVAKQLETLAEGIAKQRVAIRAAQELFVEAPAEADRSSRGANQ